MDPLTPVLELGVSEAYSILTERLGVDPRSLPSLDAIENEDWGRDLLFERFLDVSAESLAAAGLRLESSMICPAGNEAVAIGRLQDPGVAVWSRAAR